MTLLGVPQTVLDANAHLLPNSSAFDFQRVLQESNISSDIEIFGNFHSPICLDLAEAAWKNEAIHPDEKANWRPIWKQGTFSAQAHLATTHIDIRNRAVIKVSILS